MRLKTFLLFCVCLQAGLVAAFGISENGLALMKATKKGDVAKVEALLAIPGIWVDEADTSGATPLRIAALYGYLEVVELLVEKGADLHKANNYGETPLPGAASGGHLKVVSLLLEKGADLHKANNYGNTPLHWAASNGHLEVVRLLVEKGADLNKAANNGNTTLYEAAWNGHLEVVRLLLEKGADIHKANNDGKTPLYAAAWRGHIEVVRFLLEKGADLNKADNYGTTPFKRALEKFNPEELTTLLSMSETQAALRALSVEQKRGLLEVLLGRELGSRDITAVIERFEALSGVTRSEVAATQRSNAGAHASNWGSQTTSTQDPWHLCNLLRDKGVEAVRAFIGDKALVGIVTVTGLTYGSIVKVGQHYQATHKDRILFGYMNEALLEALGVERFAGFVFPGAGDNYPGHLNQFTLENMPESKRTDTERFYQAVYAKAQEARVPTFGICAGAQHLVLSRGGALTKSTTWNSNIELEPLHVPHFMSLDVEARKQVLERCEAIKVKIDAFRAHSYAAVKGQMADLTLASEAEGITPMAYYRGFENIATQFHPEARYSGVSGYGDSESQSYQTRLLDSFFELCQQHQAFVNWGRETGKERDEVLDLRDSMNARILERLRACRKDAVSAASKPWNLETNFLNLVPAGIEEMLNQVDAAM